MTPRLPSRTAFVLGMALSLLPALGPFSAALLLVSRPLTFNRRDLLWAASALAFGVAGMAASGPGAAALAIATVAGPWIVFRTFVELKWMDLAYERRGALALGLLAGFALAVALGLVRSITELDVLTSRTVADAIVWRGSPALFGHSVLVVGGLIALLTQDHRRVAWGAMGVAAFGILISGSLEAALAWAGLGVALIALRRAGSLRSRGAESLALLTLVAVAWGLAPLLGWGRLGFVLPGGTDAPRTNLLAGTEVPRGDWWDERWVEVRTSAVTLDGAELTAYRVEKLGPEPWLRLQQLVRLTPGATYTLSGWIEESEGVPGFQGWGEAGEGASPLVLRATLVDDAWAASLVGPGRLLATDQLARDGSWRRVAVTFDVAEDADPLTWFVGFTPDARAGPGVAGRVAGMMLERSEAAGPYRPGVASSGLSFGYARAPLWRVAWEGIRERPLVGWGPGAYADAYRERLPGVERQEVVPAHPHNLALWILFERGVVGLIGLGLLLVALFGLAVRYRDLGLLAVVAAILFANLFDATLLSGAVLYPLAAVAGWRSALRGARRSGGTEGVRQVAVRVSLAGADLLVTFVALLAAQVVARRFGVPFELTPPLLYGLLVWPALAWREGLYPGYGSTPAQELKMQVTAWALAVVLYALGAQLFPASVGVPPAGLAALAGFTLIGLPVGRAGTKRVLHAMRVWGRPVVILGAGETGQRVARALQRTPLDGLQPLALFDDDRSLKGRRFEELRVRGTLEEALAFAQRHRVQHAIVAIPSLAPDRLDQLISGHGRVFRRVQFMPRLGALPSEDVVASDLDGMLALEVRNGLFSPANRFAKRTADLIGALVIGVPAAPVLLALWTWVRLDSRGGGLHHSERVGQDGRRFHCLKFRTMHEDAEDRLTELLAADPALAEHYARWHKLDDDPRITRAGRFLRRTSLDELPQLWNVLRGQMSLVGPRPYLAREIPDMGRHGEIIFQAKPGMTGFWQVAGRNDVTFAERLEMEAHYVRNWSVWWDAILLIRTPLVLLRRRVSAK